MKIHNKRRRLLIVVLLVAALVAAGIWRKPVKKKRDMKKPEKGGRKCWQLTPITQDSEATRIHDSTGRFSNYSE